MATNTNTREKLIAETVNLLKTKGYHGTGINEILRNTKIPKGSLYHHFKGGKDVLVTEALRSATIKLSITYKQTLKKATTCNEGLKALIDYSANELLETAYKGGNILINVSQDVATISSELQNTCKDLFELVIGTLEAFFMQYDAENWHANARSFFTRLQGAIVLCKAYQTTSFLNDLSAEVSLTGA